MSQPAMMWLSPRLAKYVLEVACGTRSHRPLTRSAAADIGTDMAQSFLIFDFGSNEEAAQQARHRIEGWKQAFRLDKKLLLKFDREEQEGKKDDGSESKRVVLIVRLDFSDHERLSQQRWLDRIPSEAPFKEAQAKVIRHSDIEFGPTTKRFDDLE
jgi:hypothetical protein